MAKQKVECSFCGGSHDGTPSGERKHVATAKHQLAMEDYPETVPAESLGVVTPPDVTGPADAETTRKAAEIAADKIRRSAGRASATLMVRLDDMIERKAEELARRQADHAWRVRNRPAEAEAYYTAKVAPLREEIEVLRAAVKLIRS